KIMNRFAVKIRFIFFATLADSQQRIRGRIVREELAAGLGYAKHVLVLQAESSQDINQRFKRSHHPCRHDLVTITSHVRLFVEMKSDPVSDKTDGIESQLVKLFEKRLIDLSAASAWLDHVHHKILACDQIRPNLLLLCGSLSDHGGAANAGQVTI